MGSLVPLEAVLRDAEHEAVAPPLLPAQFQRHGPLPLTVDAVHALQRLAVGALVRLAPFEEPHAPLTPCPEASFSAEQVAVVPPSLPAQVHCHGPLPLTVEAVQVLQRFAVGLLVRSAAFEEPHAPFVLSSAEQVAVVPPSLPAQVHCHGPLPLTVEAVPVLQRFAVGLLLRSAAFEEPHAPFVLSSAEQVAVVPRPLPKQLHDHGPLPLTVDAVPELQRLAVGALVRLAPFEEPHAPVTNCACAEPRNTSPKLAAIRHLRIKHIEASPR